MDCASIGRQALQVDLSTAASDIRHVALRSGETLRFTFEGEPGPFGTLTLIEGAGSPRQLLVGPSGTGVSFTAQRSGAFGFQFAKSGEAVARFTVACASPARAHSGNASRQTAASGSGNLPLREQDVAAEALQTPGLPVAELSSLDFGALAAQGVAPAGGGAAVVAPQTDMDPHADLQMKLQWLDRRYRPAGPEGQQVDPNASGVEIGFNYKLESAVTVGALAQVNPATEMLLGGQHSLADQGWMAGPFATIQLAPGLMLDARAAWGEGESGPDEAVATAAQRHLLSARLANAYAFGAWRFTPSVNFNYSEEALPGSGHAAETPPAAAGGRIDVGPELAYRTDLTSATFIEPRLIVGGFWNFDSLAQEAAGAAGHPEMRLKAEAGVTFGVYNGATLQALGGLEQGDQETPEAWSGRLQLSVPLK